MIAGACSLINTAVTKDIIVFRSANNCIMC
jgi:hypothetical protein